MFQFVKSSERERALLPLYVITAGADFVQPPVRRPNGAPMHQIFFVDRGVVRFRSALGAFDLEAGTAVFMKKGYPMQYECMDTTGRTGWISFDGACIDGILTYFDAAPFSFQNGVSLQELRRACSKAAERKAPAEVLSKMAYDLVLSYFGNMRVERQSDKLIAAKAYIEENYQKDLAVSTVAQAVGILVSLLYRLFREEEGNTPVEYLRVIRLDHAKRLLMEVPLLSVSCIASECGFSDTAYFCKVFRDHERMTPTAYRHLYMS